MSNRRREVGPFTGCLLTRHDRNRGPLPSHLVIQVEREHRLAAGGVLVGVRGMTLLPQKFCGAEKHSWPKLPSHDVRPLVQQQRQVAVRADPFGHHLADDRLRRRPHHQGFFQLLPAGVGDDRQFRGKPFDVFRFPAEVALRNQQREVRIFMAGVLDAAVQFGLQQLPHPIPVWPDHHGALGRTPVHERGLEHHLVVPRSEVLTLGDHTAFIPCHAHADYSGHTPLIDRFCRGQPAEHGPPSGQNIAQAVTNDPTGKSASHCPDTV